MNLSHSAFAYLHESLILENSLCFKKVQYRIQLLIYRYVIYIGEIHKNGFRIEAGWNNFIYELTLYHINTIQNGQLLNIMSSYVPSFYIPFHSYFHVPFWQCELNLLSIFLARISPTFHCPFHNTWPSAKPIPPVWNL